MTNEESEQLLMKITDAFGLTKHDFVDGVPIYTKWGNEDKYIDIADLGHHSLKISKNLGDVYIEKISTDGWVIVGEGTALHCDDIHAGEEIVKDFTGFLM